jgi:hypothetical protein
LSFFLCFSKSYSQTGTTDIRKKSFHNKANSNYTSYYISTDVLSLLNTAISNEGICIPVSGEVCINHTIGLKLNAALKSEVNNVSEKKGYLLCPEVRFYFLNNDCSALHIGAYCSFEESTTAIEKHTTTYSFLKYNESVFEAGISGGYKILFNNRWVLNPVAFVGISNRYQFYLKEAINTSYYFTESVLNVQVFLQAGYRF